MPFGEDDAVQKYAWWDTKNWTGIGKKKKKIASEEHTVSPWSNQQNTCGADVLFFILCADLTHK